MHRLRIALFAALIAPPSAPASAAKTAPPPLSAGAQSALFSPEATFNRKETSVAAKDLGLLESSGYRFEEDGRLFEPGVKSPVINTDYYYILEDLRSHSRLKALLELNLVLSRSDYGRRLSAEDRKEIRRIGKESWWLLSKRTRKQVGKQFSETEIWKLDRSLTKSPAAPPYEGAPISLAKLPDGVPFPVDAPLRTLIGPMPPVYLGAAPRNLNPDVFAPIPDPDHPLPLRKKRKKPAPIRRRLKVSSRLGAHSGASRSYEGRRQVSGQETWLAMLPLSPMRAMVPAAPPPAAIPLARQGIMKPKTRGFVSLPEAPIDTESFKKPDLHSGLSRAARAAAPPLLAAPAASAVPAAPPTLPSDEEIVLEAPSVGPVKKSPAPPSAPTPQSATPTTASTASEAALPRVNARSPAARPKTRRPRIVKFNTRKFGEFLASAPYGKAEKSLLRFLADHTREPERSQALGLVTLFMPHIIIDSQKAGAHAHYSIGQVPDSRQIQIALHDGPVLIETGALFKKNRLHFLPDSAEYYAGIGVSPPTLQALSRERPPEKEEDRRAGRIRLYQDGSMRLHRSGEQLAGALLRSLMMLDGAIRGWTDDPFHMELRAITAEFRFYRTLHKETGKEPVLDREARALYEEWLDRPEDFLDIMVQNIAGRRLRHEISVLKRSGALPKGAVVRPFEIQESPLLIPAPESEALKAWLEAERRIRGDQ